jgi:hypothetical protein
MKRLIIITVLVWLTGFFTAFAQLDKGLLKEIATWEKGKPIPARLLKFPDDWKCVDHVRWVGSSVEEYIEEIKDSYLLAELIFDDHTQADCFRAAVKRFISLKGIDGLARLVADKQALDDSLTKEYSTLLTLNDETNIMPYIVSSIFERPVLATLMQLVHLPYITLKAASIDKKDMETKKAINILRKMGTELAAGRKWKDVYEKFSDANLDMIEYAKNPKSIRTLVHYNCDGVISPCGFDIMRFTIVRYFPRAHLKELFRAEKGYHIIETSDAVYLYYIEAYFDGSANQSLQAIGAEAAPQPEH